MIKDSTPVDRKQLNPSKVGHCTSVLHSFSTDVCQTSVNKYEV